MPIRNYECSAGHVTEVLFKTIQIEEEANLQTVNCSGRVEEKPCRRKAKRVAIGRTLSQMIFGAAYAYATPSDRAAWMKALDVQGWNQTEHTQRDRGGEVPHTRDRLR